MQRFSASCANCEKIGSVAADDRYSRPAETVSPRMIFDPVPTTQMHAAQLLAGATMAAFVVARFFGRRARIVRLLIAGVYIAGVSGFVVYALM